jgi:hypothetical protein
MFATGKLGRFYDKMRRTDKDVRPVECATIKPSDEFRDDALHYKKRRPPWIHPASSSTTSVDRIAKRYAEDDLSGQGLYPGSNGSGESTPRATQYISTPLQAPVLPAPRRPASPMRFPMPKGPSHDIVVAFSDDEDEEFASESADLPMAMLTTSKHRRGGYGARGYEEPQGLHTDGVDPMWDTLSSIPSESTSSSMDGSLGRSVSVTGTSVSSRSASLNEASNPHGRHRFRACHIQQDFFLQHLSLDDRQWVQLAWGLPQSVFAAYEHMYMNGLVQLLESRQNCMGDLRLDARVQTELLAESARIVATPQGTQRLTRFMRWALMGTVKEPFFIHAQLNSVDALQFDELQALLGPLQLTPEQFDLLRIHSLTLAPVRSRPLMPPLGRSQSLAQPL